MRRRAAARRRLPGRRGADARQRVPAVENDLEIIPVINKIDLPGAQPEEARRQIEEIIGLDAISAILASAKEGHRRRRDPRGDRRAAAAAAGDPDAPLKALIFDSWYDAYRGVVIVVRVIDGARGRA